MGVIKREVAQGLAVLAALTLITVGAFGLAVGLVRLAGPWGPIAGGAALTVLGVLVLALVVAWRRHGRAPDRRRGRRGDQRWHPDYGHDEYRH